MDITTRRNDAFERVRQTDATVAAMLCAGWTLEDTIVALVAEKRRFVERIMQLEMIAPRKITLPDGRVMVWRCPDVLVPETLPTYPGPTNALSHCETHGLRFTAMDGCPLCNLESGCYPSAQEPETKP